MQLRSLKISYNILLMINKCSPLSQNGLPQTELLRPHTQAESRKKQSITQSSTSVNRYKVSHRQIAQEARIKSLSQTQSISLAKRLNTIIRGNSRRSNTVAFLKPEDPFQNETISECQSIDKQKVKQQKQIEFGKKLLLLCKRTHQQVCSFPDTIVHHRVKSEVKENYDFKISKKVKTESLWMDFNKNEHSMYSRSRDKVIIVEREKSKKEKEIAQTKKYDRFESMFYKSYLTKFKDRRKLLRGKNQLMKMVSN